MFRTCLLAATVVCLTALTLTAAAAAVSTLAQTITRTDTIKDLAVSPSGGQLAVVTDYGLYMYQIRKSGTLVEPPVTSYGMKNLERLAFTPGGARLYATSSAGLLYFFNRSPFKLEGYVDLKMNGQGVQGVYVLEDPSLLFLKPQITADVTVVNHRDPGTPVEYVKLGFPNFHWGGPVVARADASMVFWTVGTSAEPRSYLLYGKPFRGTGEACAWELASQATGLCVGPDPDHLLVTTVRRNELRIYPQQTGASIVGAIMSGVSPSAVQLTNDGAYAVVIDYSNSLLRAVSGQDLRARLDPAVAMPPEVVRSSQLKLTGCSPIRLALHPTKPIAYVASMSQILRVNLAIPGIERP